MKAAIGAVALAISGSVAAAESSDWVQYGVGHDGTGYFLHAGKIKRLNMPGKAFQVWTNHRLTKPKNVFRSKPSEYVTSMNQMNVLCDEQKLVPLTSTYYSRDGAAVHTDSVPEPATAIVPGSVGEQLAEILCN